MIVGPPVCVDDFERHALATLPKKPRDYYKSGAGEEYSLGLNIQAFKRLRIRPRMLINVANRDLSVTVFGEKISMPIGISPSAMQRMAHPDGEVANVRAAEKHRTIYTLSTLATTSIEDVATSAPNCVKWFQLYIYRDRATTAKLVRRAEASGFKAICLTVDAPIFGIRLSDVRNKFTLPSHLTLANFTGGNATNIQNAEKGSGLSEYVNSLYDDTLCWDDVKWLKQFTKLPVLVKGVLTAEDALIAKEYGIDGIVVSNHGGRQLDGVPASIEALPEIVRAVKGTNIEVFLDGGVRQGVDVFKALALGAKMVFVGRPALWGLAYDGENGVKAVLDILRTEFDTAMALAGCKSISDIKKDMIVHESYYSRI